MHVDAWKNNYLKKLSIKFFINPSLPESLVACHRDKWRSWLRRVPQKCPAACRGVLHFAFAFILLFYFLTCIYQNSTDSSLFKFWCTKTYIPERVWRGGADFGDLGAYSVFLKNNLFKDDFYGHVLVMSGLNETNPELFFSYWPAFLSYYLFPIKIEIDNSYKFVLDEMDFRKLSELPLITKMYGETDKNNLAKRYCLVQGVEARDYKKWAIYVFPTKEAVNIFTLPVGWQGIKASN